LTGGCRSDIHCVHAAAVSKALSGFAPDYRDERPMGGSAIGRVGHDAGESSSLGFNSSGGDTDF
jgi:hypothetical protein